jgi:hypothetical protein
MDLPERLPVDAQPRDHLIQFYGRSHQSLVANVGQFLRVGLRHEEGLLVIGTLEHCDAFARELCRDPGYQPAVRDGRVMFLDAGSVLARATVEGKLAIAKIESVVTSAFEELRNRTRGSSIRVFGEMVGILWLQGRLDAARELESCWNKLLQQHGISLFCAYPIDRTTDQQNSAGAVDAIIRAHTHFVTSQLPPTTRSPPA